MFPFLPNSSCFLPTPEIEYLLEGKLRSPEETLTVEDLDADSRGIAEARGFQSASTKRN
jgi:hypothetical protein